MKVSKENRGIIADEIDYLVKKMEECPSVREKLYYFSAAFAVIHRVFNQQYDSDLVYIHSVLERTYQRFMERLEAIQKGGDDLIPLIPEQFVGLVECCKELANSIAQSKDAEINAILRKFAVLAYSTTGNGHYLSQKGWLKI